MKRMISVACLLAGVALLSGCPKKNTTLAPPTAGTQVGGAGASTSGNGSGPSTSGSALGGANGANGAGLPGDIAGQRKIIYFDFDKSEIKPEFADIIKAGAQNLTGHPGLKLKLEGSTDERGTREYNIGLGERRAQAVRRALMLQGVPETQLSTVSFGAERPAAEGDDESAWAQNRRVELVYLP
jgi:peptidoglycan-associated lipoprotein